MSTLSLRRVAAACGTFSPATPSGVLRRLIAAREEQTRRRVYSCFARQSDEHLARFGWTR
jgi:hypothetical protein